MQAIAPATASIAPTKRRRGGLPGHWRDGRATGSTAQAKAPWQNQPADMRAAMGVVEPEPRRPRSVVHPPVVAHAASASRARPATIPARSAPGPVAASPGEVPPPPAERAGGRRVRSGAAAPVPAAHSSSGRGAARRGPVRGRLRPGGGQTSGRLLGDVAVGGVQAGDRLQPHPRAEPADQVVQRRVSGRRARRRVAGRVQMAAGAGGRAPARSHAPRSRSTSMPKPGVDLVAASAPAAGGCGRARPRAGPARPRPAASCGRSGTPAAAPAARRAPSAASLLGQRAAAAGRARRRMSSSSPIGSGRVSRAAKCSRRPRRARPARAPARAPGRAGAPASAPEAPRQRRAGLAGQIADPAQAEPGQLRHGVGGQPSAATGRRRQRLRVCPGGAIRPAAAPGRRGTGAAPPRSQCRRFAARDRVARASWSMASPERAAAARRPAKRASAQAAPTVSAIPACTRQPQTRRSPASSCASSAASPPKRCAQPVRSTTSAVRRLLGHPGRELSGPAAQRRQEAPPRPAGWRAASPGRGTSPAHRAAAGRAAARRPRPRPTG